MLNNHQIATITANILNREPSESAFVESLLIQNEISKLNIGLNFIQKAKAEKIIKMNIDSMKECQV